MKTVTLIIIFFIGTKCYSQSQPVNVEDFKKTYGQNKKTTKIDTVDLKKFISKSNLSKNDKKIVTSPADTAMQNNLNKKMKYKIERLNKLSKDSIKIIGKQNEDTL